MSKYTEAILGTDGGFVHMIKNKDFWLTDNQDIKKSKVIYSVRYDRYIRPRKATAT